MKIGVPAETLPGETRVAATPETVQKLTGMGHAVTVQSGAGMAAGWHDVDYAQAGAELADAAQSFAAPLVLKVRAPSAHERPLMPQDGVLVGMLNPFDAEGLQALAAHGLTTFALEAAPRTTRAQSMDVLSSQANLAGYKAVMLAADQLPRIFPMLMTAAGTLKAARVVVLGVGVGGLQAIATAKRLGAVVEASDVRPSVQEQVVSLGAKFITVPYETDEERTAAQGIGGYAQTMPASWLARQQAIVAQRVALADVVITTALIPGHPAPILVTEAMVQSMKPGSVIVDMAASAGGNCPLTQPDQTVRCHGVTLIGHTNLPALLATDASALYARNVLEFLKLILRPDGAWAIPADDAIVRACLMTQHGAVLRP